MSKTEVANGSAAKKKAAPKSRKRKTSDVGALSKVGNSPAKRLSIKWLGRSARSSGTVETFLKHMLFGFGDEAEPLDETAELMEDLVVEYVHAMTKKAMELATIKGKLDTECFIFLIRKDPDERYDRIAELLRANDEFRAALNSGFDPSDEKMY
ncbi:Hypothetical protein PHPALM_18177 [Phytophthora palmivora]|uniref:Transcription initiation factor TFIID subunit 13 n=1 Tax=Phytophthora palmivora TaxID=4796 RepID=A0A2P4XKD8_9STRA|nr:Hypothetical protein PHPALM_18177 [Phytophthora palmivora]